VIVVVESNGQPEHEQMWKKRLKASMEISGATILIIKRAKAMNLEIVHLKVTSVSPFNNIPEWTIELFS